MKDLDEQIRQLYNSKRLSDGQVEEIRQAAMQPTSFTILWGSLASCLLVAVVALFVNLSVAAERTQHTVREAAMNHKTEMQLEVRAGTIEELNSRLPLLPFTISLPERLTAGFEVLGARYCSISGHLAVHIKLIETSTRRQISLFVTDLFDELDAIDPGSTRIDGVDIELWHGQQLFYITAAS